MPHSRPDRFLVAVAFIAFVSLGLPDAVLGVAWPSVRREFALPISRLGALLTASVAGYLLSSFFSGQIVRGIGVGRLLMFSSGIVAFGLAGYAASPAWAVMVGCAFLIGIGSGAIDGGINTYAAAHFPPRLVTWLHACFGVGATLGPLTMTLVLAVGAPWRRGYAVLAVAMAAMAAGFYAARARWNVGATTTDSADDGAGARPIPAADVAGMRETLRRPAVWINIFLFFLYTGIEVTAGQWLYSLFTEARGIPAATAGVWVGAYWGMLTVGRFAFGAAATRFSRRAITRCGMAGAPVASLMLWFGSNVPALSFAGAALMGLSLAPIFPMLISATPDRLGPRFAPQAIGFQVAAANLGVAALPGAAGLLARVAGLELLGPYLLATSLLLALAHETALRIQLPAAKELVAAAAAVTPATS